MPSFNGSDIDRMDRMDSAKVPGRRVRNVSIAVSDRNYTTGMETGERKRPRGMPDILTMRERKRARGEGNFIATLESRRRDSLLRARARANLLPGSR